MKCESHCALLYLYMWSLVAEPGHKAQCFSFHMIRLRNDDMKANHRFRPDKTKRKNQYPIGRIEAANVSPNQDA